jgi:transcription-repair coupling factor (superfamily II helicase)
VPQEDEDSARFFELLKVKLCAQAIAVNEVSLDKGRLKLRISPQTSVNPGRLLAWVRTQRDAQLTPDGSVLLPIQGHEFGAIHQAQRVLEEWAGLTQ